MPSAFIQAVNDKKYARIDANNASVWTPPKEIWVNDGGTWKEPKEIWVNDGGTWKRATTNVRFVTFDGSATYIGHATAANFNMYVSSGAVYGVVRVGVVLGGAGTVRTIFSYGTSTTNYQTFEIGTDNKVHVKSRYNSGTAYDVSHATALSTGVYYNIEIKVKSSSTGGSRVLINITDVNGSVVGTNFSSNSYAPYSSSTNGKFIGKNYANTGYFNGTMFNMYVYGESYAGAINESDAVSFANSTVGGTTVECGTLDWTIYGGETVEGTG